MKKIILLFCLTLCMVPVFAQDYYENSEQVIEEEEKVCVTVGILQGGGSLIGADLEFMPTKYVGFQVGAGFVGAGAALNIHLKPTIRSSFFSLAYWHQGFGETHAQSLVGSTFVYRSKKWFTAQLGLGVPTSKGPAWPSDMDQSPVMLMYSIGAYFPF